MERGGDRTLTRETALPKSRFDRLARRQGDGQVKYFEGTPISHEHRHVGLLAVALQTGAVDDALWLGVYRLAGAHLHPLALIYAASGSAMISATLRVPKPWGEATVASLAARVRAWRRVLRAFSDLRRAPAGPCRRASSSRSRRGVA